MTEMGQEVRIYLFDAEDGREAKERLAYAVSEFCEYSGIEEPAVSPVFYMERTEKGKPYFPDFPEIRFSISHSGRYWACALSGHEVGMDLQEHARLRDETAEEACVRFLKMAKRFFHPLEAKFVEKNCYENFFTVWTAREAYVKYTGQGIDRYFSEHCVVSEKEPVAEDGVAEWKAMGKFFHTVKLAEDYTLCICTGEKKRLKILEL